jgi:tungstate transport system substrate-binding protein
MHDSTFTINTNTMNRLSQLFLICLLSSWSLNQVYAQRSIVLSSTTSTEQSGFFGYILPVFEKKTGIQVKVVAVGTGQALDIGRRGDADVVFVHDKLAEEKFVTDGFSEQRIEVMYNDFVLIGPKIDQAKIAGGKDVLNAFRKVSDTKVLFVSRGDKSGTHAAELRFWKELNVSVSTQLPWYKETGSGMGPALNTASAMNGYILSDRATWLTFKNRGDLAILVQGDPKLFNQYGVMLVSSSKFPQIKKVEGQIFIDWLISKEGQDTIASFKVGNEQLFFPNAKK